MTLPTAAQLDALQELINIGVGRAANMLNQMLDVHVQLYVPQVKVLPAAVVEQELAQQLGLSPLSTVQLRFSGSFSGLAQLVFPTTSAAKLVSALTSESMDENTDPTEDLDAIRAATLSEIGNIVLNGVMGMMSNLLHQHLQYTMPVYLEEQIDHLLSLKTVVTDDTVLLAKTRFLIEKLLVTGDIILLFKIGSFDTLLSVMADNLEVYDEWSAPV